MGEWGGVLPLEKVLSPEEGAQVNSSCPAPYWKCCYGSRGGIWLHYSQNAMLLVLLYWTLVSDPPFLLGSHV